MKPLDVQMTLGKRLANLTSMEAKGGGYDPKKLFNSPAPPQQPQSHRHSLWHVGYTGGQDPEPASRIQQNTKGPGPEIELNAHKMPGGCILVHYFTKANREPIIYIYIYICMAYR